MSGLIDYPAQIWVAVSPVDMRGGLDGLSAIVQQNLGHQPCAGRHLYFVTVSVTVCDCCCGMATVYGYVSFA